MVATKWFTIKEVALYLNVSEWTIERRIKDGKLQAYRFGNLIRINQDDLRKYIEESKQ